MDQDQQTDHAEHRAVTADMAREQAAELAAELAADPVVYVPTDDELALARDWHGGQASMLYAVASTGELRRGTVRPSVQDDRGSWWPATDLEWSAELATQLWREVFDIVENCGDDDRDVAVAWRDKLDRLSDELGELAATFGGAR